MRANPRTVLLGILLGACAHPAIAATPAPTVQLRASNATILAGYSTTLVWSSSNATTCAASGAWSGPKSIASAATISPTVTSTYALACSGPSGTATTSVTVAVTGTTAPPAISIAFAASPTAVAAGGSSTLAWSTTNASTCTASGAWSGARSTAGSFTTAALLANSTYTLACTGAGGSMSRSVTVVLQSAGGGSADAAATLGPLVVSKYATGIAVPAGSSFQQPTIWYPSGGSAPYPGVVFVPGYTSDYLNPKAPLDETDVIQWARFLASHGFIVMFINSSAIQSAGPTEKATALVQGVAALAGESARPGSPIGGLLQAQNIAVMGHSFGGVGALFAANGGKSTRIKAVIALSPVPDSSGIASYPNDQVPSLIFGGQGDPLYTNFQGEYDSIPAYTSKLLAVFLRNSQYSSMHNIARNPLGTHSTDAQVARYGLSFLELYLVGDASYQQFLVADPLLQSFAYHP